MENIFTIYSCGDSAITIDNSTNIDALLHRKLIALFHYLKNQNVAGIKDVIPAYNNITVVYDIMQIKKRTAVAPHLFITSIINDSIKACSDEINIQVEEVIIPVCYDISFGIDLEEMSKQKNLSIEDIISIHASKLYDVYMIGFLPGFAYLGFVDEAIAMPRLDKPRINIPAGSVGIAGNQTGIYPLNSPGGWNIIGKTPLQLFNAEKEDPCLLKPGNKIKFVSISLDEFNQLKSS